MRNPQADGYHPNLHCMHEMNYNTSSLSTIIFRTDTWCFYRSQTQAEVKIWEWLHHSMAWRQKHKAQDHSSLWSLCRFLIDKIAPETYKRQNAKATISIATILDRLFGRTERLTFKLRMNWGTRLSFTKATAQPPHPAPVSLAPRAPLSRQTFTSSSNSGQLQATGKIFTQNEH